MTMRTLTALLIVSAALAARADEPDPEARLLHWMDRIAQEQLDRRAAEI